MTTRSAQRSEHRAAPLRILVVRSGGFAGISREWRVEVDADLEGDAAEWRSLIDACPWGVQTEDLTARDRFTWRIEARVSRRRRTASIPDRDLAGPWRRLVDRVQEFSGE